MPQGTGEVVVRAAMNVLVVWQDLPPKMKNGEPSALCEALAHLDRVVGIYEALREAREQTYAAMQALRNSGIGTTREPFTILDHALGVLNREISAMDEGSESALVRVPKPPQET